MPSALDGLQFNPAAIGQQFSSALMSGMQFAREQKTQAALADYAMNPGVESANGIIRHDPMLGLRIRRDEEQRAAAAAQQQQEAQERQIVGDALNGNPMARKQVAYFNSELYLKLGEQEKKQVDQLYDTIAQQAFSILQRPVNERGQLIQQALAGLQAQGIDTSQFKLTGDPTQDLKTALARAGQLDEWEKFSQPSYQAVGEGGLAGFQYGQPIQQNGQPQNFAPAADLPPGFQLDGGAGGDASGGFLSGNSR